MTPPPQPGGRAPRAAADGGAGGARVRRFPGAVPGRRRCLVAGRPRAAAGRQGAIALRGVPPSFDLEDALEAALDAGPRVLASADDVFAVEHRALSRGGPPVVVAAEPRAAPAHAPVCG